MLEGFHTHLVLRKMWEICIFTLVMICRDAWICHITTAFYIHERATILEILQQAG
jgi:hypothetical protein